MIRDRVLLERERGASWGIYIRISVYEKIWLIIMRCMEKRLEGGYGFEVWLQITRKKEEVVL